MFDGIYCPSVTVTGQDGRIDLDAWGQHLDHLANAGVNGVLLFGSIGEFYAFSLTDKKTAIEFAIDRIAGRMQLLVGIGSTIQADVINLARFCADRPIDAVVMISPYYFGPTLQTARHYFASVAESIDVPIMLYNFPARTGSDLTPDLVAKLAASYPQIVGLKDTVDTISHTRKVITAVSRVRSDFAVLSGFDEYYLVNRASGGSGLLSGLVNVEPEIFVAMDQAYKAHDFPELDRCAKRVSHLMAIYDCADLFISAIKGGVRLRGMSMSTDISEPACQLTTDQLHRIEGILQ